MTLAEAEERNHHHPQRQDSPAIDQVNRTEREEEGQKEARRQCHFVISPLDKGAPGPPCGGERKKGKEKKGRPEEERTAHNEPRGWSSEESPESLVLGDSAIHIRWP